MSEPLPDDVIARIDITEKGVRFNLREAVPKADMVETLRMLADGFEQDTIIRIPDPAKKERET